MAFSIIGNAQIVNIPDADFKSELIYNQDNPIDTNNDGEIQVSEALAVSSLQIGINPTLNIQDLTGISAFSNLIVLGCNERLVNVTSIDLSTFSALQTLTVSRIPITALDVSSLVSLQNLIIYETDIISFNVSGLTNLTNITLNENTFQSLTLSDLPNLQDVQLYNNNSLTSLVFTATPQIKNLGCDSCTALTSVNLSGLSQLENLSVTSSGLTSLDVSGLSNLKSLFCFQSYSLTSLITTGATAMITLHCENTNLTSLDVSAMTGLQELYCNHDINWSPENRLTALNLSGLTQLINVNCEGNNIPSLDVSSSTNLTGLNCARNLITNLNVGALTNLISLDCSFNQIASLNVLPLVNLTNLNCSSNLLSILDVSSLTNLQLLYCGANNLSNLNVTNLQNLTILSCRSNQLTVLDLTAQTKLGSLSCSGNLISSLDLSNLNSTYLNATLEQPFFDFSYNPNLEFINMKFAALNNFLFSVTSCPNLVSICADEANIPQVIVSLVDPNSLEQIQVNTYCNFTPGGIYNTITGTYTFDGNNNGCDALDQPIPFLKVNINDGTESGFTFSNAIGQYNFYTNTGSFVITPITENPYFDISPTSATVNFAALNGSTQTQNFCITPVGIHYDVEIALIPILSARPGFDATYKLVYKNKGNQILSGNIDLSFNDAILDFLYAAPNINNQSLNHLNWNYTALYPFESREIDIVMNLNSPQETPAVNINDILHYVATISTNGQDETPIDTIFELDQTVIGSFDPNDKTCLEGNTITPEMVGNYLHYLIRFQNSGTAAAENIVVKDIIDTNKFDISSLQLTSTSHPQVTKITGNKVEFQFQNINLPAEIDDEPGSHGYIAFKIKTKNNLVIGNSVSNKADIYFDYNFPIETNTATSTVALLGLNQFENTTVTVAPNPTKNAVRITSKGMITSVQLFDVQGRILETQLFNTETVDFSLSQKNSGVYFIKIITEKGVKTEKIIKE